MHDFKFQLHFCPIYSYFHSKRYNLFFIVSATAGNILDDFFAEKSCTLKNFI